MKALANQAINQGDGILLLVPNWIPRLFNGPGRRLKLHPDDITAFGVERGNIVERWFTATSPVAFGAGAPSDEGMSYVYVDGEKILLKTVFEELGAELIGDELMAKYGKWPMFSKFYDYQFASFHHLHHMEDAATCVGLQPKPEAYYFPVQMNISSVYPIAYTFFGFDPSVTKEEIMDRLRLFEKMDNRITELSRAFRLEIGTGWYTPPGVLHSCGPLCTYEPQWNSDVASVWENNPSGESQPYELFAQAVPEGKERDIEYIYSLMDMEVNFDPYYREKYFRKPIMAEETDAYSQKWITYGNPYFGAKELVVYPGQTVIVKDAAAYGTILIQGYGSFGTYRAESQQIIRFGQQTYDEFFVSDSKAKEGVKIENRSNEPMVFLKHFANNCGMPE